MKRLVILLSISACGGSGSDNPGADANNQPPTADAPTDPTLRLEPWSTGSTWSYNLTDPAGVLAPQTGQLTTLTGPVDVGGVHAGKMALIAHIDQMVGTKDVYEAISGDLDVRYKTDFYDDQHNLTSSEFYQPYRVKLDESPAHVVDGATWSETFTQTSTPAGGSPTTKTKTDQWRVVSANESITVADGTFTALHVQRTSSSGSVQDYWYARGVGKLQETGGGQTEELASFTPGP
jgi:hypothetical protein